MQNIIKTVIPGSASEEAGILPGETLVAINGNSVIDVLDYMYYGAEADPELTIKRLGGETVSLRLHKPEGADAGLEFETYLMDRPRSCANKCIFCFVDQLPKGMRDTLYFKDDDVRLSFLTGSYITLTNLSEREVQRVIDLKISPINISVHSTDPKLRSMMLGNKNGGRGLEIMKRFAKAGIEMNCQIVCCPGINDGAKLGKSMRDLARMHPHVWSVSIIPVGLTKYREGLTPLRPFDAESARKTVAQVEKFADKCLKRHKSRIFFCSDELYLKAGLPVPEDDYYEGYPQLENGVGLLRLMDIEFDEALEEQSGRKAAGTPFSIATGVSAAAMIERLMDRTKERFEGINGRVYAIKNDFFGHTVDVAGLITGKDLIAQLRGKELGEILYIPDRMLRDDGADASEGVFLDDITTKDVERELGVKVKPTSCTGKTLLDAMLS